MARVHEGGLHAGGKRFGIVVSRFNALVSKQLLEGARDCLTRHGCDPENVDVAWVPGAFEIPLIARKMALSRRFDAVICLGAVIRGSTPHFDYVAGEVSRGIASAGLESGVPCLFGVLTTDTVEQAIERAGVKAGNKGWEAAAGALEMANLLASWGDDRE
jgi:6,7-dimethyl-8-ribityllumazine synthase